MLKFLPPSPIHSQDMSYLWVAAGNTTARREIPPHIDVVFARTAAEVLSSGASINLSAILVQISAGEDQGGVSRECAEDLLEAAASLPPVWVIDSEAGPSGAVRWIRRGAAQVFGSAADAFKMMTESAPESASPERARGFIGAGPVFAAIAAAIDSVAPRRCNVLIQGETGTGKEVVAREIHESGPRAKAPFVAVNCAAIPDTLLEAELFGHSKGAFTGAFQARAGKFEAANHGTIFLDEIGDMPLGVQAKLLRVLQEREVERLGGNEKIRLDVRIIAATNVDLAARVRQGLFRQDLFYRLNVFAIRIPPLRERLEDLPVLARHFASKVCRAEGIPLKTIGDAALRRLAAHDWPGNARELENTIESAIIRSGDEPSISVSDLEFQNAAPAPASGEGFATIQLPTGGIDYQQAVEEFEHALLTQALARTRGNKTAAATLLRLKRTTLSARMRAIESRFPRLVA